MSKAQVWEILAAPRPNWKDYNRLDMDIQRSAMKLLAPGGTLIRRIFGEKEPDDEIFRVDAASTGFAFANSASLFFAPFTPMPPPEVRALRIGGVRPDTGTVLSGKYPLALRYVMVFRKETPELERFWKLLARETCRRAMREAGLLVMLPPEIRPE